MTKKSYEINYYCTNCGASGKLTISFGKLVENSVCPTCGCRTIIQQNKNIYVDGNWKGRFTRPWWLDGPTCSQNHPFYDYSSSGQQPLSEKENR